MPYDVVGVPKVGRSVFNLSYEKKFTGSMGYLYPSMVDEVVPGDIWEIRKQHIIRFMPMVAPVMHEVNLYEYTFFVPYRLLMDADEYSDAADWEDFIKGGSDGDTDYALPTWSPSDVTVGSLWDHMGFPIGITPDADNRPLDFPKRAYNMIYNEWFMDQEIDTARTIQTTESLGKRRWEKDYFTTARSSQQRGTSPAIPVSGTLDVTGSGTNYPVFDSTSETSVIFQGAGTTTPKFNKTVTNGENLVWDDPQLEVDLSNGVTVDMADFRLLIQTQRWMERNMRAGARYHELVKSHFGVDMGDHRADIPELIGAIKTPIIISEVLQTGQDFDANAGVGTMYGHGIAVNNGFVGKYRVKEYGLIMSILSVMPRTSYSQGIDKQWTRETLYDFYWPAFANLSEQAVYRKELYLNGTKADNETVFGYQARYNELRTKRNITTGKLAYNQSLNHWTMSREFGSAPTLSVNFINSQAAASVGGIRDDVFVVDSEDHFVCQVGNIIRAVRPLPLVALPGYLDRN